MKSITKIPKTAQGLFNVAVSGLAQQKWELCKKEGFGAYRGFNGLKCAIGHCIPDNLYNENMEGLQVGNTLIKSIFADNQYPERFLNRLQVAHDVARNSEDMIFRLKQVAEEYNLKWPKDVKV